MLKNIGISLFLLLITSHCYGQNKRDYYWPFGKDQNIDVAGVQAFALDFNEQPFEPVLRTGELQFGQMNASICDKEGHLLFYTNGCAVANRFHQIMPNGDSINAGPFFDDFWGGNCDNGYPGSQDITILPDPNYDNGFYIIHKPTSYNPSAPFDNRLSKDSIKYTYVDMDMDNGRGDVIEKNINFYEGSLVANYLTTIAHKNKEDWWIMNPVFPSGFLVFLLSSRGLEYQKIEPGPVWDERYSSASGYARFSPDGTKYAYFNQYDGLYLYDFDRAAATLTSEQHIPWRMPTTGIFAACEWSQNSRFLYLARRDTLWQLDTQAQPLEDGLVYIDEYIDGPDPRNPTFGIAALGPDCRIYIRSKSSSIRYHVIHKPDEPGQACDFVQQALLLPSVSSSGSFPNFPRFRVDEIEKCDPSIVSIAGEAVWWRRDLTVYPSPASDFVTAELPDGQQGSIYILDMSGQIVHHQDEVRGTESIAVAQLAAGTYSVEFVPQNNKERVVYTKKIAVVR